METNGAEPMFMGVPVAGLRTVLFYSTITAMTTGLGALPLCASRAVRAKNIAYSNCAAAGMCLAASLALSIEGFGESRHKVALGMLLGYLFIVATRGFLERHEDVKFDSMSGASAQKTLLLLVVMTAHSFAEGVGIGVSFKERTVFGAYVSTALAIHNIPEGLAIALVLVPQGTSVPRAAAWAVFSSLPQPLMALPAYLFVHQFGWLLPIGLGFAASAMAHVACFDLLRDAKEEMAKAKGSDFELYASLGTAFAGMLAVQYALHEATG